MFVLSEELYESKLSLREELGEVEEYINKLANTPKTILDDLHKLEKEVLEYDKVVEEMKLELEKVDFKGITSATGTVAAGAAAGVGVAAFAPTAAMSIATTFGVASTGTAISTLSGAAATNAALAWLGGGALAAGGSGMTGGAALLALAGPVGWAIGGAGLILGGVTFNGSNKKVIEQANAKTLEINKEIATRNFAIEGIKELKVKIGVSKGIITKRLAEAQAAYPLNYEMMTENQKYLLGVLVNTSYASAELLNKYVSLESKEA